MCVMENLLVDEGGKCRTTSCFLGTNVRLAKRKMLVVICGCTLSCHYYRKDNGLMNWLSLIY